MSRTDGSSHTVNEARPQGSGKDEAKDAHAGDQLREEAVLFLWGK